MQETFVFIPTFLRLWLVKTLLSRSPSRIFTHLFSLEATGSAAPISRSAGSHPGFHQSLAWITHRAERVPGERRSALGKEGAWRVAEAETVAVGRAEGAFAKQAVSMLWFGLSQRLHPKRQRRHMDGGYCELLPKAFWVQHQPV